MQDVVERSREKSNMLQGFGDAVLRAEELEDQLVKSRKHAAAMQSKLDTAFAKYHNDIQEMQAKSDDLVRKNKSLCNKNKGRPLVLLSTCWRSRGSLTRCALSFAELETRVEQLKTSETDLKNLFYREQEARQVLELDYKELAFECDKHVELRIASDRDLVSRYKSLQKLNEDCEALRAQLKELEEAALPISRLLVPHPGGPKIAPLVDRLKEAVREASGEVDPEPGAGLHEVLLPKGARGCSPWRASRQLYRRVVGGAAGADGAHCSASSR
jgi:Skp family chaperone for outer membrane proteins